MGKGRLTASYKCVNHEPPPKTFWNVPVPKLSASGSGFYVQQAMEHPSPPNKTTFDISTNPEDRSSARTSRMKRLDGICPRTWRSLRTNNDKWIDDQLVATPFTAIIQHLTGYLQCTRKRSGFVLHALKRSTGTKPDLPAFNSDVVNASLRNQPLPCEALTPRTTA